MGGDAGEGGASAAAAAPVAATSLGLSEESGGLIVPIVTRERHVFAAPPPRTSMLGVVTYVTWRDVTRRGVS